MKAKKPPKHYEALIYFHNHTIQVKAANQREAKRKAMAKLKRRTATSLVDHQFVYIDER